MLGSRAAANVVPVCTYPVAVEQLLLPPLSSPDGGPAVRFLSPRGRVINVIILRQLDDSSRARGPSHFIFKSLQALLRLPARAFGLPDCTPRGTYRNARR